jgi:ABC-type uncharacterized transport system permease subunit
MMQGYRKFWFGLALGIPYLLAAYHLGLAAIQLGRDLTATGLLIGAIATGVVGITSAFVWGNAKEQGS